MKKVLTLFVKVFYIFTFLLVFTTVSHAQEVNEVDFLTSGKWFVESVQIGNQTQEFNASENWMVFHSDGKYQITMSSKEQQGNWNFNEEQKAIQIEDEEALAAGFKIKTLNAKELLVTASEGDMAYTMKLRR